MNYQVIIERAAKFVKQFMKEHENLALAYHNLDHTEKAVGAVIKIARHYKLNETDRFICTVAAWFHDIGYFENIT
jgi:HD-GYP domain-containing protein (c-di-GMP phosphodiesterase class II)